MGQKLFGVDIAGLVNKHIAHGLLEATVSRPNTQLGVRTSPTSGLTKGPPLLYSGRGIWKSIDLENADGTNILVTDRIALLIAESFTPVYVPQKDDAITINSMTLIAQRILKEDPATATYQVLCRDRVGPNRL